MTTRQHLAAMARSRLETRRLYRTAYKHARFDIETPEATLGRLRARVAALTVDAGQIIMWGKSLPKADA